MGDNHAAEVQAELQAYLSSKNINSLFIQIVESLLIEKPENPIGFIVEYLMKQFPAETRDYQREEPALKVEPEPVVVVPVVEEVAVVRTPGPEAQGKLRALLASNAQLQGVEPDTLDSVARALEGPEAVVAGSAVVAEGSLLLLEEGELQHSGDKFLRGDVLGELYLLTSAPVTAEVTATSSSVVWRLSAGKFREALGPALQARDQRRQTALGRVGILGTLSAEELFTLAHYAKEEVVRATETPVVLGRQGEPAKELVVVLDGALACFQADAEGIDLLVATLAEGDALGETALLSEAPAASTAMVEAEATLLRVDRTLLARRVGSLEELLKRNMELYTKYIDADK